MKYFVAYLLSGNAKAYHERLTREISLRFKSEPIYKKIPAHITIKPPFERDEAGISEVERVLRAQLKIERAVPITFKGFARFGFRTIYLNTYKSKEAVLFARRLLGTLNENVSWLSKSPLEGNKLHASVARFLDRRQSRRIWRELKLLTPEFHSILDNVTILKKEKDAWRIHSMIPVRAYEEGFSYEPLLTENLINTF